MLKASCINNQLACFMLKNQPLPNLESCWAKTDLSTGLPVLTVRDHCIHVGAVADTIIHLLPSQVSQLLPAGACTLVALHDIGKITLGFQKKCTLWRHFSEIRNIGLEGNHAKVSHSFLGEYITDRNPAQWAISLGGHHGKYNSSKRSINFPEQEKQWAQDLREELTEELIKLFGQLPDSTEKPTHYQLHWFTGLITFADWIGSNEDFFPLPTNGELKNHTSLPQSKKQGKDALNKIQWSKVKITQNQSFRHLFPFSSNPLQDTLSHACDAPGLYIVEATMGLGKTEAALAAAYQRWESGDERGIYFALPTQLTSNRIFKRISPFLEKSIDSTSPLTLIHGSSWLNENNILQINASNSTESSPRFSHDALQWFSSSRRALLAPFGVGTIDQALLSVLPTKYASLRFFGLAGKTVILDEVHSYDAYTFSLICKLVEELTKAGSSVIVLSATLTQNARHQLVKAAGGTEKTETSAYPLITAVKRQSDSVTTSHYPVHLSDKPKTFHLKHIYLSEGSDQDDATLNAAVVAAENSACVLIIRNTVKTAQASYDKIKTLIPEHIPVGLLHSRFPYDRRQEIEKKWVGQLEKNSHSRPSGCVLVATQVVEQSVDIDADLLITDLAPSDLILQRLGRVHRHQRTRPQGYESPQCWILHPSTTETEDAAVLKKQLGSSAYIYPPYTLIRSSEIWSTRENINLPTDIREILENTEEPTTELSLAAQNLLSIQSEEIKKKINTSKTRTRNPLNTAALPDDDQGNQTRWGNQQSATLVLLKSNPSISGSEIIIQLLTGETHTFNPFEFDFQLAKLLHKNAVRIPRYLLPKEIDASWLNNYFFETCTIAILEHGIGGDCQLPEFSSTPPYSIHYNQNSGISFEKISTSADSSDFYTEEEECWW